MNNSICSCVFIKKLEIKFAIIIVYVDDLTLVEVPKEQQIIWKKKKNWNERSWRNKVLF